MEYVIISLVALLASALTLFSGFGLGTILVPVFAVFFPVPVAIALTAIVHFLNNVFKLLLFGKYANWPVVIKFGIPSIIFAFIGALCLTSLAHLRPLYEYNISGRDFFITPVKIVIAAAILIFSLIDLIPRLSSIGFNQKMIPVGGALSGFFGGLSGNQGALRSAFLIKLNLPKESFIATGVIIACFTDISRLTVYFRNITQLSEQKEYVLLIVATLSAFMGAFIGNRFLRKITIHSLQIIVGIMLILFSIALGTGLI